MSSATLSSCAQGCRIPYSCHWGCILCICALAGAHLRGCVAWAGTAGHFLLCVCALAGAHLSGRVARTLTAGCYQLESLDASATSRHRNAGVLATQSASAAHAYSPVAVYAAQACTGPCTQTPSTATRSAATWASRRTCAPPWNACSSSSRCICAVTRYPAACVGRAVAQQHTAPVARTSAAGLHNRADKALHMLVRHGAVRAGRRDLVRPRAPVLPDLPCLPGVLRFVALRCPCAEHGCWLRE